MKRTACIITVLLFVGFQHIQAQSSADRAKAYYFEATTSFDKKDYRKALEYCQQVEDILGSSNARVEALRIKSYYELGNVAQAQQALNLFSSYSADESLSREIAPYIVRIEEAAEEKRRKEELAIRQAEAERQIKEEAARAKRELIERAIAEGGFDENGLKKVRFRQKEGFIDNKGNEVIPIIYDYTSYLVRRQGYIEVSNYGYDGGIAGLYRIDGKMILPLEYKYNDSGSPFGTRGFQLGLLNVRKNGKYGFVNEEGKTVIPFRYDSANGFEISQTAYYGKKSTTVRNVARVSEGCYPNVQDYYIDTRGNRYTIDSRGNLVRQ